VTTGSNRTALGALLAIVILTVAGCAPSGVPAPERSQAASESPTPSPTPDPTAPAPAFRMPATCAELLPAETLAGFEADGVVLLGGPGGVYGDGYLAEPTPEQRAGGITCIWGDGTTTASAITISVAPLTASTRPQVVSSLSGQGLNANVDGPVATFAILGDDEHRPAILNVLRADSWISVIMTIGGPGPFDRALDLADDVAALVYPAS
jgi:hypothetical protein